MPTRLVDGLRGHLHFLLIVPLVIIVMTWPTAARIFDSDELWFHTWHPDMWSRIWDAWHIERVLAGQAELWYTDSMFHPHGFSLAFEHFSLPHALLYIILEKLMPADSAYNLLFLLILFFNACCAYILILHLLNEKWSALYGALVFILCLPLINGTTTPDLIMIGTIPLTIYFFRRALFENRRAFAAIAGLCAGVTAFIAVYAFVFNLMTFGIIAVSLAVSRWKERAFWRALLLFIVVCAAISSFRFYPILVDAAVRQEGFETHHGQLRSNELLECCIVAGNPITADLFLKVFTFHGPAEMATRFRYQEAYLGYINLFLALCALFYKPMRRRLAPWLVVFACFAILRLGHFLRIGGVKYPDVLLPEHFLTEWFPALFGSIYNQEFYQFGVVAPLAILASFGLARLIRTKPPAVRASVFILSALILMIEFYFPFPANVVERENTAHIDWLASENDDPIKLIDLPRNIKVSVYSMFYQTLHDHPIAFGYSHRNQESAKTYVRSNALLQTWDDDHSFHCLPTKKAMFLSAMDQLLADGFTHIVVHNWLLVDQVTTHSLWNVPAAYDNGFVSVYRLRDMRESCQASAIAPPIFDHFALWPAAMPGPASSILSLHPSERIDDDLYAYLVSLFSNWPSPIHLYQDGGQLALQSGDQQYTDLDAVTKNNQVLYVLYNRHDTDPGALIGLDALDEFALCLSSERDDGSVIEQYLSRDFSCALATAPEPLQVAYDNGAKLENALVEMTDDQLDVQLMWGSVPSETHSTSLQIFDAAGSKVLSQDSVLGPVTLARHRIDVSSLAPDAYYVKLILYNYETGVSAAGTMIATGAPFDRELEIGSFNKS